MAELFKQGLADPRGCEYQEIEITAGLGEGDVKTHGWVLPDDGQGLFAVTWAGVVYPLKSIGPPIDVRKDVADLLAQDQKNWGHYNPTSADIRGHYRVNEWMAIQSSGMLPIKAALLLRQGHAELAEAIWKQWFFANKTEAARDPYVLLANEWLQVAFDQASFAHMWGDDPLALAGFRRLGPVPAQVEATAAQRGIAREKPGQPYVEGLDQLPALLADQERRAKEPLYVPVLKSGVPAQGPERIAALIRDLELVAARQEMNPGETEVINDPIVQALIQEGEPAVDPLIECLADDNRLTRSLYTFHMMGRGPMIPVCEPAYVALTKILQITMPLPPGRSPRDLSSADRKALAQQFRDYWSKNRDLSPVERWYATLRDDNAGANAWFDAAANIVQPTNGKAAPVSPQSAELRGKSHPSVSDLIVARFNQAVAQTSTNENADFDHLSDLLYALADWDGKARIDDLRAMTAKLAAKYPHHNDGLYSKVKTTVTVYEKRVALGDSTALGEYAAWLQTLDPDETDPSTFKLMWQNGAEPVVVQAATALFLGKASPWRLVPPTPARFACDLISTPLIGLPVFRQSLLSALADTTVVGDLYTNWEGTLLDGRVRFCDYVALRLAYVEEFPEMKFDWPEKQRNAVVERCKMLLRVYGDNYRYGPQDENQNPEPARSEHTAIAFIPLDHPATPEDVAHGRAIFSLNGTTRICKIPPFPISAQRPDSPQDPVKWSGDNGITYTYDTSGKIWQAEEVLVDGNWQRYYGFAGRHQLEKVPAAEIVLPGG